MMQGLHIDRPELNSGPNPLIEALPPFMTDREVASEFGRNPLRAIPWREVPAERREMLLLTEIENCAAITAVHLPIVTSIQRLLRAACARLNPLRRAERDRVIQVGLAEKKPEVLSFASHSASGGLVSAITGMGKTRSAKRAVNIFTGKGFFDHGPSKAGGYQSMRQIPCLYIDFPSNGSRVGLLRRILFSLDTAAETDYSSRNARNIDALLVQVYKVLVLHRVALLIIDESQRETFNESPWHRDFVVFFLSLMNFGISVLLMGNPLAFSMLRNYAQDMRRFSAGGVHHLAPAATASEPWWEKDFTPRFRRFSVVDEVQIDPNTRAAFEFEHTAGIPGLLELLQVQAERGALRRAGTGPAILTLGDYQNALRAPEYREAHEIARQWTGKTPRTMVDLPDADPVDDGGIVRYQVPEPETVATAKSLVSSLRAKTSAATRRTIENLNNLPGLTLDAQRMLSNKEDLLAGLACTQVEFEIKDAKRRRRKSSAGSGS